MFHGDEQIQEGSFKFPSFYNNLNTLKGYSLKALYKAHQNLSIGIEASLMNASDWKFNNNIFYSESKVKMQSLAIPIQLHSKFSEYGIFNRSKFFIELSPVIGKSSFSSDKELFDTTGSNSNTSSPKLSFDQFYGLIGTAGIEFSISQSLGFFISYSLQYNQVKSLVYNDEHVLFSQLKIGIFSKLSKDEKYLYRN